MQDRRVMLFRAPSKWLLAAVAAPVFVGIAFTVVMVASLAQVGGSLDFREFWHLLGFAAIPLVFVVAFTGVVIWTLFRTSRTEWVFSEVGFIPGRGKFVPWDGVFGAAYAVVNPSGQSTARPHIIIYRDRMNSGLPLYLPVASLTAQGVSAVLAELVAHVAPQRIDPTLLVIADLFSAAAKIRASSSPTAEQTAQLLESLQLQRALNNLKQGFALSTNDPSRPWLLLLLAQSYLLLDRDQEALDVATELERVHGGWQSVALVKGLAYARLGQSQAAEATLQSAQFEGPQRDVVRAAAEAMRTAKPPVPGSALRRTLMGVCAIVGILAYYASRLLGAAGSVAPWIRNVSMGLSLVAVVGFLGIFAFEVAMSSLRERTLQKEYDAAPPGAPARSPIAGPTASPLQPGYAPDHSSTIARRAVYGSIVALILIAIAFVAVRVIGVVSPSLLGASNGEWFAVRTFDLFAIAGLAICFVVLVWGVNAGALTGSRPVHTGIPSAFPSAAADSKPALNADIPTGWAIAAVGALAIFALCALGIAAWGSETPTAMTTDAQGAVYAVVGNGVYRWDAFGGERRVADLASAPEEPTDICGLRVGADGLIYVADMSTESILVFGPDGRYRTSLNATKRFSSSPSGAWDISAAPVEDGAVLLDRGVLARIGADGRSQQIGAGSADAQSIVNAAGSRAWLSGLDANIVALSRTLSRNLRWAQDVDTGPDGSLYVADTSNGRVLRLKGGSFESVNCLELPDGYRYPSVVRVAPDGAVYVVMRKRFSYKGGPSSILNAASKPDIWMGKLYRVDFAAKTATLVDVRYQGQPVTIDFVGFGPDGTIAVSALNEAWFYRMSGAAGAPTAQRMTQGALGARAEKAERRLLIANLGPPVFWALAVVVPIGLGFAGVMSGRRKRNTWGVPAVR